MLLACCVRLNHRVHDCHVIAEQPKGYGFGEAARRAAQLFRIWPARRNGEPIDDASVGIPIAYRRTAPWRGGFG